MDWKTKYLKYKLKYNKLLKEQQGGFLKDRAKAIADTVNDSNNNIFKLALTNGLSDPILNMVINSNSSNEKNISELFQIIIKSNIKYYHTIIKKDIGLINNFTTKTYSSKKNHELGKCKTETGQEKILIFTNQAQSGLDALNNKILVNELPNLSNKPNVTTWNYVLNLSLIHI
jgi:hypothetical protein